MDGWMDGWMMDKWMDEWVDGWMVMDGFVYILETVIVMVRL